MMSEKARQKAREYNKKWRAKNKDKVASYNKNYWEKKAEEDQKNNNKGA